MEISELYEKTLQHLSTVRFEGQGHMTEAALLSIAQELRWTRKAIENVTEEIHKARLDNATAITAAVTTAEQIHTINKTLRDELDGISDSIYCYR